MNKFWLFWLTSTVAAAICVALAVRQVGLPKRQETTRRLINLTLRWRQVNTLNAVGGLAFLAVFLTFYTAMIFVWEDFTDYTNWGLTFGPIRGHAMGLWIDPINGRFTPLAFLEFNLINRFTDTNIGYHVPVIVQLLILFFILLMLDAELSVAARAALAILAFLNASIITSFSGLLFQERDVLFFLACLVLSVKRFEQTQSIAWAVAAVVSAQIMIYCKEPAFLLLFGFAMGRLILRCRDGHHRGWDYHRLWDKESLLDLCLAFLALLFLLVYVKRIGIHPGSNYATAARVPWPELPLGYLSVDPLAWLFTAVVLGRIYLILRRRVVPLLFWDGLAFGGVAYFLAYLYLSIFTVYYLAPVDLIAVLYVGRLVVLSWKTMHPLGKVAAMLLASIILFQDVVVSAFVVFERKNVIHAKVELASVVETQYRSGAEHDLRLFFPFADLYTIADFAGYLVYRGVPVEGMEGRMDEASGPNSVILATGAVARDGPCLDWTMVRCRAVKGGPAPGDLVIMLPDDEASLAKASVYREPQDLLFSYEPRPPIPDWLHSLFASFHPCAYRLFLSHGRRSDFLSHGRSGDPMICPKSA